MCQTQHNHLHIKLLSLDEWTTCYLSSYRDLEKLNFSFTPTITHSNWIKVAIEVLIQEVSYDFDVAMKYE